jgi:hypothetical protein
MLVYWPFVQCVHAVDGSPSWSYQPGSQSVQPDCPNAENCPSRQVVQDDAPAAEWNPALHHSQTPRSVPLVLALPAGHCVHELVDNPSHSLPGKTGQQSAGVDMVPFQQLIGSSPPSPLHVATHRSPCVSTPSVEQSPKSPPAGAASTTQSRHAVPPWWSQWHTSRENGAEPSTTTVPVAS